MTVLDKGALRAALESTSPFTQLIVTPLLDAEQQIQDAAVDVRLDSSFIVFERATRGGVDPLDGTPVAAHAGYSRMTVPFGDGAWLHPGETILGATLEFIRLPESLSAYVIGRSTWGRLGLEVATAIMVHPGFSGSLTLELVNNGSYPLKLYPGLRIAQLVVHTVEMASTAAETDPQELGPGVERASERVPLKSHTASQYSGATRAQPPGVAWTAEEIARIRAIGDALR
jgi:dCTP deaminase